MTKRTQAINVGVSAAELASISSPPQVVSPFGTFEFFDGLPLPDTVDMAYDSLYLLRSIEVFLDCVPGASMLAARRGYESIGVDAAHRLGYTDPRADSAQLMLTANTITAYGTNFLNLHRSANGPVPTEPNGDTLIRFGPDNPNDDTNWLQTLPDKGWFTILRLYGPLQPWFDKTWRPGEIEPGA